MKKSLLFTLFLVVANISNSQDNFIWDEIIDSLNLNKDQIYSSTKMFIASNWNSANHVIQNDDKEAGNILIKGISHQKITAWLNTYNYIYSYTLTFKIKDNKVKVSIRDVFCDRAYLTSLKCEPKLIHPFTGKNCPTTGNINCLGPAKEKVIAMMSQLNKELDSIIDLYVDHLGNTINEDDW
ncbi:MAG: DUF4468 domain-containing protein [Saprospiraceae bacterium]|nr:DUF4468 domain-containing protein [Saprospiraceae bacterium]